MNLLEYIIVVSTYTTYVQLFIGIILYDEKSKPFKTGENYKLQFGKKRMIKMM